MLVIAVPLHTVCALVPAAEESVKVATGFSVIVPVKEIGAQGPVVVTVNVPAAVGEPEMVTTPPATLLVSPAGKPVTLAPVALPPNV